MTQIYQDSVSSAPTLNKKDGREFSNPRRRKIQKLQAARNLNSLSVHLSSTTDDEKGFT